jgi:uncharacterized phage protein (TIGR01671 family)
MEQYNQRVIRFSAWDNGMFNDVIVDDDSWTDDIISDSWHCGNIMQYTGLKDKNGKEIFEGDICRVAHSGLCEIFWDVLRARFGVRWIDKTFKSIRGEVEMIFNNHEIVFEVIGNIYEKSDLLNK